MNKNYQSHGDIAGAENQNTCEFTQSALVEKLKDDLVKSLIDTEKYRMEIEKKRNRRSPNQNYYDFEFDLDFSGTLNITENRKYYYRALKYQQIGLFQSNDVPPFKLSLADLSIMSLTGLCKIPDSERHFVAKQSVSRIFEDVNFDMYHSGISSVLRVQFIDGYDYDYVYTKQEENNYEDMNTKNDLIQKILSDEEEYGTNLQKLQGDDHHLQTISVAEALRSSEGEKKVTGTIVSVTSLFKMVAEICVRCNSCQYNQNITLDKPEFNLRSNVKCSNCVGSSISISYRYVNTVKVALQDISNFNETDQLTVLLFQKDTANIVVGEQVTVSGTIYVIQDKKRAKLYCVLYAKRLDYQNKTETIISPLDAEAIIRFTEKTGRCNIIDRLAEMSFPNVIGNKLAKKGLLFSLVNSGQDSVGNRKRIHVLAIGNPGLAKSTLLRSAVRLVPNGRYESGQHSSGKSLTALVSKEENESHVLRLGAVSLANGSVCAINEIGRMNPEDQAHFLDAMEEGELTINKYGINARIKASTTIFASANPRHNISTDTETINLDNIPAIHTLIDRFDLIFVFSNFKDSEELRQYINIKSYREDIKQPDYSNYTKKHILYSKRFNPKLSPEAKSILNEYFIEMSKTRSQFITLRRRESLYRLARAIARIKLKDVVDVEDAKEAAEFYNVMISKFLLGVKIPENPRDLTVKICIDILQNNKSNGISLQELVKEAKQESQQVMDYIGNDLSMQRNYKLRAVYELLINNSNIKIVNEKPIVLKYIEELLEFSSV